MAGYEKPGVRYATPAKQDTCQPKGPQVLLRQVRTASFFRVQRQFVALVIPMDRQGRLKLVGLCKLIGIHLDNGSAGQVISGTMGEYNPFGAMGTVSNIIERIDFFRVKCALAEMGLIETEMRLPLLPLKARHREMVRVSLQKLQMNRIQTGTR